MRHEALMEILPQRVANESPARSVVSFGDHDVAALRGAASAVRKRFEPAELVETFDFTGSLTFPIETLIL
jgi:hypothetical protein